MKVIYEPTGKAGEYSSLALNLYTGCTHACRYCYVSKMPWKPREAYYEAASPKKDIIARLRADMPELEGNAHQILLSFMGDVYQPAEEELGLTRQALEVLIEHDQPFTILTKGGSRAVRDFDLLQQVPNAGFGTSLVFLNQENADHWEPNAASVNNRIRTLELAHSRGIFTWVSLEPVIDPNQALEIIRVLHPIVNHWKIGKLNHDKAEEGKVDWMGFREEVKALLDSLDADYYLKKSLTDL